MRSHIRAVVFACGVTLLSALPNPALANPADQLSYMTFSQAVSLPGMTLPAGEYVFRLLDRTASPAVVVVLNKEQDHVYATLLTTPAQRMKSTGDPAITFYESPAGTARPIRAWFFAGEKVGLEFAHPEERMELVARYSASPVLTTDVNYAEFE